MRKILTIIIVAVIFILSILSLNACQSKGNIWLERLIIDAELTPDGDLVVKEQWDIKLSGAESYRNLYKSINLYDGVFNHASQIKDISVYDNDNNIYYQKRDLTNLENYIPNDAINNWYLDQKSSYEYEFGLVMPKVSMGERSFTLSYTITDMVGEYTDTAMLYWQMFSTDFTLYIQNFSATIKTPNATDTAGTLAWFHATTPDSYLDIKTSSYEFTASKVDAGTMLEARVLLPNASFQDLAKSKNFSNKENIIVEENTWATEWEKQMRHQQRMAILDIVLAVLAIIGAVIYVVVIKIANKNIKGDYPKYFREIPQYWTVSELGHVFYHYAGGVVKNKQRGKLLSATMLDFARRRYIEIIPTPSGDYRIKILGVPEPKLLELKPHERDFYELLINVENHYNQEFSMDDFEKYAKKAYIQVDKGIRGFQDKSKSKFVNLKLIDPKMNMLKVMQFVGIVIVFMGVVLFGASSLPFTVLALSLIASGIIIIAFTPRIPRLNKQGEQLFQELQGLKRYMLDFSNLKEYDVPKLVLWEEYLVYATMMGISKEVLKSLKLVYPELAKLDDANMAYNRSFAHSYLWTYVWLSSFSHGRMGGSSFDLGARFDTAFNNIATVAHTLVNPPKSGSGGRGIGGGGFGGGGFGGGGGGFGGGGGGAR